MTTAAFQGDPGAFSEEAAFALCGVGCSVVPCRTFQAVIDAVQGGRAKFGVLPVENTSIGRIHSSRDVLEGSSLEVVKEISLPIHHCLLVLPNTPLESLSRVLSHPAALAQCTRFLGAHPRIEAVEWYDTAGAAREVAQQKDPAAAAIASRRAAGRYGLELLEQNIEDNPDNRTQFVLIKRT